MKFMTHVPGVAIDNDDETLAQPLRLTQRIDRAFAQCGRLAGSGERGEGADVNAAREVLAMRTAARERRVPIVVVMGLART
jgi:hypothetical protein